MATEEEDEIISTRVWRQATVSSADPTIKEILELEPASAMEADENVEHKKKQHNRNDIQIM